MRIFLLILFITGLNISGYSQKKDSVPPSSLHVLSVKVVDGDTVYQSHISEVYIFPKHRFKNSWQAWRYRRLIHNVKVAYPYAQLAKKKLLEISNHLATLKTERERKAYIDQAEIELRDEFEDKLKHLTITQGRILIKLIDRETGDTSYNLVRELKGSFSAFLWQAVARLFGSNLKSTFDASGEDQLINEIVIKIQNGQL
ncbi:MAG TPA: DUF4294 domain-containing protein [Bacteroidales bacterium]|nr:DUF4294 domain-containing protein [Bacteroidales bacterium]